MKLTEHETNLIETIRGAKDRVPSEAPTTITITLGGPDTVRVVWENQGVEGAAAGSSFDEAYYRAWKAYVDKYQSLLERFSLSPGRKG
jgi:hypothetical protein